MLLFSYAYYCVVIHVIVWCRVRGDRRAYVVPVYGERRRYVVPGCVVKDVAVWCQSLQCQGVG